MTKSKSETRNAGAFRAGVSPDQLSASQAQSQTDEKICLLVLGMHRSGTSALTRAINLLGYELPDRLIGASEGNEAGHWEPENIVLFNDRLLSDMQSSWHDFRSLPTSRLSPAEIHKAESQIGDLLGREYGDRGRIILKDPRLCRLAPIYLDALEKLGYRVVPIVVFRNPAEVIRSLQKRRSNWPEGYGASQAALMWLRHVLEAELATRGMARVFTAYSSFLKDWINEISRITKQGSFELPEAISAVAPLVEDALRPDLRHEIEGTSDISGQPTLRGWCHRAHDALCHLVEKPDSASAMDALDRIRTEFDAAELSLFDLSDSSAMAIRDLSRRLSVAEQDCRTGELEITRLQRVIEGHGATISDLNDLVHDRNVEIDRLRLLYKQQKDEFLASRSWRVTAPMRAVGSALRSVRTMVNGFKKASQEKGGVVPAGKAALRVVTKDGLEGLRERIDIINPACQEGLETTLFPELVDPRSCFIATTQHAMSLAHMIARALREAGYNVSISTDMVGAEHARSVFVICPQMFESLPDHYIAIQMEQSVSSRWFTPDYFEKLNQARAVIDYSMINLKFLLDHGVPLYKLHYVPLDCDRGILVSKDSIRSGILFYGDDKCPRRRRILEKVRKVYPELKVVNNLFGSALEQELRQAAVVLNVHYYENALLETTRIYQALSFGSPVVSEESSDQDEHHSLDGIVDFAPVDDVERIIELLRPYVEGGAEADQKRAEIATFTSRNENRFEMFFRRFLLSQKMISYEAFSQRAPDYPVKLKDPVKLCLSLPETPERRALFQAQKREDFIVWDGLKATPGWIGAALSYRHMFEQITAAGFDRAIICEDDVLFPPDFDERLRTIECYLQKHDWDVFSGFIADAHADIEVLHVEEFEGQTFVHIDRTVSMVFNIYGRKIMDFLAKWDSSNHDVHSNTIDRYLENHGGTRVILTLPFLVAHRPEVSSTIWDFENIQYNELVEQSEKRLAEKVARYRKLNSM